VKACLEYLDDVSLVLEKLYVYASMKHHEDTRDSRFMRPLIENGHVYAAQPPLYKVSRGKEEKYFYSDEDLNRELELNGRKNVTIQRYKGLGEMTASQLWETTMNPEKRILLQISMKDAIEADRIFNELMGENVDLRRKFIEENADLVKDLDI
ncbi:MAG: hypothetical protein IKA31_04295, partial [Clostridia bacterium]|nr:hypothetical protein [Clostridia bacterium]